MDAPGIFHLPGKLFKYPHIGTAKSVDRLFFITNEKKLSRFQVFRLRLGFETILLFSEKIEELFLHFVIVLELVDHN